MAAQFGCSSGENESMSHHSSSISKFDLNHEIQSSVQVYEDCLNPMDSAYAIAFGNPFTSVGFGNKPEFVDGESSAKKMERAPMTIFYNGNIMYSNVTAQQAEKIMQVAKQECLKDHTALKPAAIDLNNLQESEPKEISKARKRSLLSFLERRKDKKRAMETSPPF